MGVAIDDRDRRPGPWHALLGVQDAEPDLGGQKAAERRVDLRLGDEAPAHGGQEVVVRPAAVEVAAVVNREGRGLGCVARHLVMDVDVIEGAAVADDVAAEAPAAAKDVHEEELAAAAGLPERAVVGAHNRLDARPDEFFKCREVGLEEVLLGGPRVEAVALPLGSAVHGVVLGAGRSLKVAPMVALQPPHHRHAELARQVRVLAKRLLSAAPSRVAEYVDIGRPEGEALVLSAPPRGDRRVVLGPRLVGNHARDAPHEGAIPCGAQPDHLREDGGPPVAADTVAGFVPPVVGGHAQAADRVVLMQHLVDLFLQGEPSHEIPDALIQGQVGIQEWECVRHVLVVTKRGIRGGSTVRSGCE